MVKRDRWMRIGVLLVGLGGWLGTSASGGDWTLPDIALGARTAPLLLLSRPEVQADLRLEAKQIEAARGAIADLRSRAATLRGPDTPPLLEARKLLEDAQKRWLERFLSPSQRERLAQLDLQWEGPSALISRPILTSSLGLTASQIQTLRQSLADRDAKQATGKIRGEVEHLYAERTLATLSELQRERWKSLLGQPLAVRTVASLPPSPHTR